MTEKQSLNLVIRTKRNQKNRGLFDYNIDNKKIKISKQIINNDNAYIIRQNFKYNVINKLLEFNPDGDNQILFQLRKSLKKNCYEIINPIKKCNQIQKNSEYIKDLNNRFWYIIRSKKNFNEENDEDYTLNQNDIILK